MVSTSPSNYGERKEETETKEKKREEKYLAW